MFPNGINQYITKLEIIIYDHNKIISDINYYRYYRLKEIILNGKHNIMNHIIDIRPLNKVNFPCYYNPYKYIINRINRILKINTERCWLITDYI